ncbi:50S ribosomal protein L2 [Candidatus Amesbacteria bacterium]|nr:50S ribosomal protein L2 [Candidatus Amesbacteria bacterium]
MVLKLYKPITPGLRGSSALDWSNVSTNIRRKSLTSILSKKSGRNASGIVTVRHQGGRHKRFLRDIDWRRTKLEMKATVTAIEYDPNRTANIAHLQYEDGTQSYILAPEGLMVGAKVVSSEHAPLTLGNTLPIRLIPSGTPIHNIEIFPGKGAQLVRSAGASAIVSGFEEAYALIKLPSGEIRRVKLDCKATIGSLTNPDWKNVNFGKAGRKRHMGIRPTVRGTAQNPRSHPHGGGEGRSGEGMIPKTPWGKPARGNRTRNKFKYSNKNLVSRRNK